MLYVFLVFYGSACRGVSYTFGHDIATEFLRENGLDLLCRAHQVVEDGYEFQNDRQVVTIFSVPNYCGEFDNAGAMMTVSADLVCSFKIIRPKSHKSKLLEKEKEKGKSGSGTSTMTIAN